MANHSLLTPKERARLVINSAFTSNFNRLVNAHIKRRTSSTSGQGNLTEDPEANIVQSDPTTADITSEEVNNSQWHNSSDFYVSILNYSLGYGTVLGFPRLCYKHGGGIFVIPYLTMLFLEGIPLVCLEIVIGQCFQEKYLIRTWRRIHPTTVGIGVSTVFVTFAIILYFNIIVAWCIWYFVKSLHSSLPWSSCPVEHIKECSNSSSPSEYYWYRTTLGASGDISSLKDVNWHLYLYVLIAWVLVFIYNMKGVKVAAKPSYVILIVGVVLYVALFLLVVHLDDWARGLAIFFDTKDSQMSKLLTVEIWRDAATQVFFSLGIGLGSSIVYASYNKVRFKCTTAALCYGLVDTLVGVSTCIIVFSLRGFQAFIEKTKCKELFYPNISSIDDVAYTKCNKSLLSEPIPDTFSLVFITWSDSFTHIENPNLWSSISYMLLLLTGLGSMSGMVLVVTLFLREITPLKQELGTGLVCLVCCLLGIIFVTDSGLYLVDLFNRFSACSLQWIAVLEVLSVICVFGRKKFCAMVEGMTGEQPNFMLKICWFVISPAILVTLICLSVYDMASIEGVYSAWQPLKGMKDVYYPSWCYVLIGALCLLPLLFVFGVFLIHSIKSRHVVFQTCQDFWKRFWYWCCREEEYDVEEFSEYQRREENAEQISLNRLDTNFVELLSIDNLHGIVKNEETRNDTFVNSYVNHANNSTRNLSI